MAEKKANQKDLRPPTPEPKKKIKDPKDLYKGSTKGNQGIRYP